MKDIRMLTLFKQHYLDVYDEPLVCDFSCWGYYDGMSIKKSRKIVSKLFVKRTESPISDIWYNTVDLANSLKGKYSEQIIGMFRNKDENSDKFWEQYGKLPFMAVGFLQLEGGLYKDMANIIEGKQKKGANMNDASVFVLTYYTFDTADLVVLIQSNNLPELKKTIYAINNEKRVLYFHAVTGINEAYLFECSQQNKILENWNGTNCFIQEEIKKITIKLVTSGGVNLSNCIGEDWIYEGLNGKIAKVVGHENYVIDICGTDIATLIRLLLPGGFSTHQNPLYKQGIYNIETSIRIGEEEWNPKKITQNGEAIQLKKWCQIKIGKYLKYMASEWEKGNESLYSYYHSLLQTLNTLAQYENFNLSRDIFYLIYPAFELFDMQLEKALESASNKAEKTSGDEIMEGVKNAMCQFVDSVNSLIYHTIHTDQIFLMVPGYTGTTFAIPIKLCLLYLWFIDKVIEILNDSKEGYCYRCLLVPEMESRPTTDMISMNLPHGDRLVCVKLSQRSLYMPRDLFIILTHEMAHYVGDNMRCREKRAGNIIKTISAALAYGIVKGGPFDKEEVMIIETELKDIQDRIQTYIFYKAQEMLRDSVAGGIYYDDIVKNSLEIIFDEILVDQEMELAQIYEQVPLAYLRSISRDSNNCRKRMEMLYSIQKKFDCNRKLLLAAGVAREYVIELSHIYKEIFSDVAAYTILNFDLNSFQEAYCISEGAKEETHVEQQIREFLLGCLLNQRCSGQKDNILNDVCEVTLDPDVPLYREMISKMYSFRFVKKFLKGYVIECHLQIKNHIQKNELENDVNELRNIYKVFSQKTNKSCQDIYDMIQEKSNEYKEKTKLRYEDF